jgi:hypothetical protein
MRQFLYDIILLGTNDSNGVVYIQKMSLNGELNLKIRYAS